MGLLRLRNDPRLWRLPPYLALLCMIGGILWMILLPLDEYQRRTYISENALLPGQVHAYFHSSEQNIFRGYKHEVSDVLEPTPIKDDQGQPTDQYLIATDAHRTERLEMILKSAGIKTAKQSYRYESSGKTYEGENVYGIVHGPRADGTESIVLVAPVRNVEDQVNVKGVTLLLTLARYFSRWSLWSKDIIVLITPDTIAGPQAWVDAYHSRHESSRVADLSLKSGHIQGVIVIDYPFDHHFESLHVAYDGVNGQLPNLDLVNTVVSIATGQMGIGVTIQNQHQFTKSEDHGRYKIRLQTLMRGMMSQALGQSTGAHSVFMPYHIDAVTLTAVGHGWQDEMAFGRTVESSTRSLNNLLEKLHQSFFFYLLLQNTKFVSIGTYLPSAMAIAAGFTIVAIFAWVQSGYEEMDHTPDTSTKNKDSVSKAPKRPQWTMMDRPLMVPIALLSSLHITSVLSTYLFTRLGTSSLLVAFTIRSAVFFLSPIVLVLLLAQYIQTAFGGALIARQRTVQLYTILTSLSLLIFGLELTVIATLNFSLSMFLGLLSAPLAFCGYISPPTPSAAATDHRASPSSTSARYIASLVALVILSPPSVTLIVTAMDIYYFQPFRAPVGLSGRLTEYLEAEALAWNIWGSWGSLFGVWAVWAPAWCISATGVVASCWPLAGAEVSSRVLETIPGQKPQHKS